MRKSATVNPLQIVGQVVQQIVRCMSEEQRHGGEEPQHRVEPAVADRKEAGDRDRKMKVITRTEAREVMSHRETRSSRTHADGSSRCTSIRCTVTRARPHMRIFTTTTRLRG